MRLIERLREPIRSPLIPRAEHAAGFQFDEGVKAIPSSLDFLVIDHCVGFWELNE